MSYRVREYVSAEMKCPFREWLDSLDKSIKARVQARIFRFQTGNLGDCKSVGSGVMEARLIFGAGYRIYFGMDGKDLIILLTGGDKSSQNKDIQRAQKLMLDYRGIN